jgi:uncharacterized protein (DUF1501 family)
MPILTRRRFLTAGATLIAGGWAVPAFVAEAARLLDAPSTGAALPTGDPTAAGPARAARRRILVLVQLAGGNDGVSTVIPYADPTYYDRRVRPHLAIPRAEVLPLTDTVGLHPGLARLRRRWDTGQVAIVQGVSYPNPSRSHFRGTDIWETGVSDRLEPKGWLGRYLETCSCRQHDRPEGLAVGSFGVPRTFWTEMALVPALASLDTFRYTTVNDEDPDHRAAEMMTLRTALAQAEGTPQAEHLRRSIVNALNDADALAAVATTQRTAGEYPEHELGETMRLVAQLIEADFGTSVFYVSLGGFDTHVQQAYLHGNLLDVLDQAMDAFLHDVERIGRLEDVTIMTFSEFGRRLAENRGAGTDHGVAAPMFLLGGALRGGLHGQYPSLTDLDDGDLKMQVDFRSVYATVLRE